MQILRDFVRGACDLVYPRHCILCKKAILHTDRNIPLCIYCQSSIRANTPPFCTKCSRHLESPLGQEFCSECQDTRPHFDSAWGACIYDNSMRKLIHALKYGSKVSLRHYFNELILSFLETYHVDLSCHNLVIPIPLHPVRARERGFNQSEVIAHLIAEHLCIPSSRNNLIRVKNTRNQAVLRQKERWTNIKGAFKIKHPSEFKKKSILVIDDLLTTGATASESARILKAAGAKRVNILTLAIAQKS